MPPQVSVFESNAYAPGIFDTYFGGLFLLKGIPLVLQILLLVAFPLSFLFAYLSTQSPAAFKQKRWILYAEWSALLGLSLSCLLLFQPWDELFINLRHSLHWAEANHFSFNRTTNIEGIVDFLVYFLLGVLAKWKLPLLEMAHLQGLAGAFLCAWGSKKLLIKWKAPYAENFALPVLCAFAPLALNSAHGFGTTLFAATILWAIYFSFYSPHFRLGLFMMSLIPLIRMEGVLLSVFLLIYLFYFNKETLQKGPKGLFLGFVTLFPFLLLSYYRFQTFGSVIPAPVHFKACIGNLFYLLMGMRNLMADLVAGYAFLSIVSIVSAITLNKKLFKEHRTQCILLGITLLFVLPYYPSGGDWFPSAWGRYFLPFTLFSFLVAWLFLTQVPSAKRQPLCFILILTFLLQSFASFTSYPKMLELLFTPRRALAPLDLKRRVLRPLYRTHYLSQLGLHLKTSLKEDEVIASSEIATIMFFAKRETLDTLGLTNREIFERPLRQTPSLFRRNPSEAELPYLIFKRLNTEVIPSHRPAILYTFDFMLEELMLGDSGAGRGNFSFDEVNNSVLELAYHRWKTKFNGLITPLYGGMDKIISIGYKPVIIRYRNDFCTLYFVSSEAFEAHSEKLRSLGFAESRFTAS